MTGRTTWFAKDAAWWRRSRIVELGQAHGANGAAVLDWLTCEAKSQGPLRGHDGSVKSGYAAVAYGCFVREPDLVRDVLATCVEIGLIDDFEETGRTFTCRISGWYEDVEQPLAAARKAASRQLGTTGDIGGQDGTKAPNVPKCPPTETETKTETEEKKAREARIDAWPDDLSEEGQSVASNVLGRLNVIAEAKGGNEPTKARVGQVVLDFPDHDHRSAIADVSDYWLDGAGAKTKRKDWVKVYRDWCGRQTAKPGRHLSVVSTATEVDPSALRRAKRQLEVQYIDNASAAVLRAAGIDFPEHYVSGSGA